MPQAISGSKCGNAGIRTTFPSTYVTQLRYKLHLLLVCFQSLWIGSFFQSFEALDVLPSIGVGMLVGLHKNSDLWQICFSLGCCYVPSITKMKRVAI